MSDQVRQAEDLHRQGRLDEAEALYRRILAEAPVHAQEHIGLLHRLGILAHQRGRDAEARDYLAAALTTDPTQAAIRSDLGVVQLALGEPAAALASFEAALAHAPGLVETWRRRADLLSRLGRPDEALASLDILLTLQPAHVAALADRARILHLAGRRAEAVEGYDRLLALQPGHLDALNNRSAALQDLGRLDEALAGLDRALALKPDHEQALANRGNVLRDLGWPDEALASYDQAIALNPAFALALNNRGGLLCDLGRLDDALASYDQAIAVQPAFAQARLGRARALWLLGEAAAALEACDQGLALDPAQPSAFNLRGLALLALGRPHEALESYDAALALDPGFADAAGNRGMLLTELGRPDEAAAALEQAVARAPRDLRLHYNLTLARRMAPGDPHLATLRALAAEAEGLSLDDQVHLRFALAKALGDIGDTAGSIDQLIAANALERHEVDYDEAAVLAGFDLTRARIDAALIADEAGQGEPWAAPVFIVGMPRSGTTLVEQILASHPAVFAAGETDGFARALQGLDQASAERPWLAIGQAYRRRTEPLAPEALRITDKTPDNFRFAGLIRLALPNARLIHVRRDPLDTCLSCFSKLFGTDLAYTYDLAELGRYYRAYEALMAHWRAALPEGVMLEVAYEDVVDDLEGQARRILAHCGLDWDPRCLDFHQTERWVHTASATQVRRPIYRTAIGRWRGHEAALAPLIEALGGEGSSL